MECDLLNEQASPVESVKTPYSSVTVFMIAWWDLRDEKLQHLQALQEILTSKFRYKVKRLTMNPWNDFQHYLSFFQQNLISYIQTLNNETKPLLIIYYTGHGAGKEDSFTFADDQGTNHKSFDWIPIKKKLEQSWESDILYIIDSCGSSAASGDMSHSFTQKTTKSKRELLCAAPIYKLTRGAGPYNFTKRLVDALEHSLTWTRERTVDAIATYMLSKIPDKKWCYSCRLDLSGKGSICLEPWSERIGEVPHKNTGVVTTRNLRNKPSLHPFPLDPNTQPLVLVFLGNIPLMKDTFRNCETIDDLKKKLVGRNELTTGFLVLKCGDKFPGGDTKVGDLGDGANTIILSAFVAADAQKKLTTGKGRIAKAKRKTNPTKPRRKPGPKPKRRPMPRPVK